MIIGNINLQVLTWINFCSVWRNEKSFIYQSFPLWSGMVDLNHPKCYLHSHVVPTDISSWIRSYFTERTLKFGNDYSSNIGLRLTKSYHFNWQLISGQKHRTQISTHYLTQYPHKPLPPSNVGLKIITKKVMIAWNEEYQHNSLLTSFSEFHPTPGSVHLT